MTAIVTLEETKVHLRVNHPNEDNLIQLYIDAAADYIGNYLNRQNFPANSSIKAAALLLVGDLYENRQGQTEVEVIENKAVTRLLYPYRVEIGI